jgi:hypothetical protein
VTRALLLLVLGGGVGFAAPQSPAPTPDPRLIRVFIQTDVDRQAVDPAGLRQSASDMADALAGKKKTLVVVDLERDADLVVAVMERTVVTPKFVMGLGPRPGEPMSMTPPSRTVTLRVEVASGGLRLGFTNKNKPIEAQAGWKSAAGDLAGQIDKWVAGHREEILQRRGKDQPEARQAMPAASR